jgi:bacillolysin/thermolysin
LLRATHGWNSYDNAGTDFLVGVHALSSWNNAQWFGSGIRIGDGNNVRFDFLTARDVITHEFTHGVTQETAGLDYEYQAGGMNESFSDIFAIMVDRDDTDIGEDCTTPGTAGDALRRMSAPASGTAVAPQIDHFLAAYDSLGLGYYDDLDPHYASGLVNFACYFMIFGGTHPHSGVSVQGIGYDKTERIFFHTLTIGLLNNNDATYGSVARPRSTRSMRCTRPIPTT